MRALAAASSSSISFESSAISRSWSLEGSRCAMAESTEPADGFLPRRRGESAIPSCRAAASPARRAAGASSGRRRAAKPTRCDQGDGDELVLVRLPPARARPTHRARRRLGHRRHLTMQPLQKPAASRLNDVRLQGRRAWASSAPALRRTPPRSTSVLGCRRKRLRRLVLPLGVLAEGHEGVGGSRRRTSRRASGSRRETLPRNRWHSRRPRRRARDGRCRMTHPLLHHRHALHHRRRARDRCPCGTTNCASPSDCAALARRTTGRRGIAHALICGGTARGPACQNLRCSRRTASPPRGRRTPQCPLSTSRSCCRPGSTASRSRRSSASPSAASTRRRSPPS